MEFRFKDSNDLKEILNKYGAAIGLTTRLSIGYNGNVYILHEKAGSRENYRRYSVIILEVDWDEEKVVSDSCYFLGEFMSAYYFVQPFGENILLVDCRCSYNGGDPDKNAYVVSLNGELIRNFCLGDGIQSVLVRPDMSIVTGYFDEGVFGNMGWGDSNSELPLGAAGIVVWDENGHKLFEADSDIADCYAMNIGSDGDIWYYYYTDFLLTRFNGREKTEYDPHIKGAGFFILIENGRSVIFDSGYGKSSLYEAYDLCDPDKRNEPCRLLFGDDELLIKMRVSYASMAAFIDNRSRLFTKRF